MRTASPPLLPIFRSRGQARLLARLFLPNATPVPVTRLANEIGVAKSRVSEELDRLERAGLVASERIGNSRLVRANDDSPFYPELQTLILKAFGPTAVLSQRLRAIDGIDVAYIYGSWAARYLGEAGEMPADVDVLVVGAPDVTKVRRAAREASRDLARDVNPTILSADEWLDERDPFVRTVRRRPLVRLDLGDE